eukprot:CAMPEP_0183718392 /NCGR_PEP_ID=MMETSP0737-20130205/11661_1 /TAXON_ID=385413 /ORGANISM="Thalassiosira miniscula, Strain CCMP1093" /LENGTH=1283 /DNA_ID=CAMNT_0025947941 /DNA_START=66 /DNA_END=3914 /DNA_ORIENTATION=-
MSAPYDDEISDSDDEEEECRVCRGPAEEGRPLFKPCKCSGSIGLTHQDCLTSWLDVTRGDGRCELCSTRFKFAPQYAEGAPDRLSAQEVCFRILRRLGAKWLPRGLRALFAASLWLVVLPLSTSYIYHGWMHRPSEIATRWSWDLAKRDTVGGAVIAIIIIVSFLSLMSFAEFLRFQWGGQAAAAERRGNGNRANRGAGRGAPIEGEIDDIIVHHDHNDDPLTPFINHLRTGDEVSIDGDSITTNGEARENFGGDDENILDADNLLDINEVQIPIDHGQDRDDGADEGVLPVQFEDEEDELEAFMRAQEEQEEEHELANVPDRPNPVPNPPEMNDPPINPRAGNALNRPRDDARFEPQFEPLQPAFADLDAQDDGAEVEINLALDELLGFRGPLLALIRNLLWLLLFNTAYLGVFAFAPSRFGSSIHAIFSKLAALFPMRDSIPDSLSWAVKFWDNFVASMYELDTKSEESNLIYQPSQVAKMGLGYVSFSIMIFMLKAIVTVSLRSKDAPSTPRGPRENERIRGRGQRDDFRDDVPLHVGVDRDEADDGEDHEAIGKRFLGILECAGAITKVVTLLFIKMLFLPLMLGIWLDLATLSLFEKTWSERIEYAGGDLFGSVFLHWVTGITFMLLVTVSVLQLREVAHPDILARVIRPQEPQPDLLGNLLQESGTTHTKRVLLSLCIYAALLAIHIWLPARLILTYNIAKYLPLFQPKFCHIIMPQIQVPAELFIFHLCMLGVLEKYKNNIGELQHHWLLFMGNHLGMTNQILPLEVDKFSLVGTLPLFAEDASKTQLENMTTTNTDVDGVSMEGRNDDLYPLWNNLLSETDPSKREETIRSNIYRMDRSEIPQHKKGITLQDGKKLLSSHSYLRLPPASATRKFVVKTSDDAASNLLPTSIGPYRLKQGVSPRGQRGPKVTSIEVWREVVGKAIPRPPEGWDDLGVGGAERHGRWAWGDEHLSEIENSVAVRTPFFSDPAAPKWRKANIFIQLMAKMIVLLLISWVAISMVLCTALNIPLYTGHFAMFLLRIPNDCVHDPFAFALGVMLLVPVIGATAKLIAASNDGIRGVISLLWNWVKSFKPYQTHEKIKTLAVFFTLWLVVCPAQLGFLYSSFFVSVRHSYEWLPDASSFLADWATGTLLLNSWAAMCYFQMFTKKFWADIVAGEGQGNGNENRDVGNARVMRDGVNNVARNAGRENNGQDNNEDEQRIFTWQGKDGAIACAFESIKAFASGWEWDKIDKQSLLQDCTLPVSKHLAIACAVPTAASVALAIPLANLFRRQIW